MFAFLLFSPAVARTHPAPAHYSALDAVVRDLCARKIALLGEGATHGDGATEAFKVELVERLITRCGFNAILFEASHYEFLRLGQQHRSGTAVSQNDLAIAVGGLWRNHREFQSLLPFLTERFNQGGVRLGGLDDQLGGAGQDFANVTMFDTLSEALPQELRESCRGSMHRSIYQDYSPENPNSAAERSKLRECVAAASRTHMGSDLRQIEAREMLRGIARWVARDQLSSDAQYRDRDEAMAENFSWLMSRLPRSSKVIIWGATVHLTKQVPASGTVQSVGSRAHGLYGRKAFSLGFSALGGTYRVGRQKEQALDVAPADSLERRAAFRSQTQAAYLGPGILRSFGEAPAAALRHVYQRMVWAKFLDGMIVFREERPSETVP